MDKHIYQTCFSTQFLGEGQLKYLWQLSEDSNADKDRHFYQRECLYVF